MVRKIDAGSVPLLGRPGALVGAASLRESTSTTAQLEAEALAVEVKDPVVRALLAVSSSVSLADGAPAPSGSSPSGSPPGATPGGSGARAVVAGELLSTPRGPVALVLLGVTGILAAVHLARLLARLALRYRRPAELQVTARSLVLKTHTELLGRVLREREVVIPVESLLRASREVRYPRLGLYAGLFALAVGSYFGISLLIDGVRAGSPELIGIAALLLAAGVGLDFLLESAGSGLRGKCRMVIVPRKGPALAIGDVDATAADAALKTLAALAPLGGAPGQKPPGRARQAT